MFISQRASSSFFVGTTKTRLDSSSRRSGKKSINNRGGKGERGRRAVFRLDASANDGSKDDPILLRAARGEDVERPPVWLMRQAGRYMAEFRAYSEKYPFRHRSETPEIAIELSMQPWRAFKPDGVIMFSDILTPLPALGVEFDVVRGKGPVVEPVRSMEEVKKLKTLDDPDSSLPFIRPILSTLRKEIEGQSTICLLYTSPSPRD